MRYTRGVHHSSTDGLQEGDHTTSTHAVPHEIGKRSNRNQITDCSVCIACIRCPVTKVPTSQICQNLTTRHQKTGYHLPMTWQGVGFDEAASDTLAAHGRHQ